MARTGLTRSAIRGLIGELVDAGLASEVRADAARDARAARRRSSGPIRTSAVVLALDIAVDSLAVALVGLGGEVLDLVRIERPRGHSSVDRDRRPAWPNWRGSILAAIRRATP